MSWIATRCGILLAALPLIVVLASCSGPAPAPVEERTFVDPEGGFRYVVPPHWWVLSGEARSPRGTLFTIEVTHLEDASPEFVNGLPGSVLPQIEEQTNRFFGVVGTPRQRQVTLGGEPAHELVYPVRVRAQDRQGEVAFWIARRGSELFVLRASYPPDALPDDRALVAEALATWTFTREAERSSDRLVPQLPAAAATPAR